MADQATHNPDIENPDYLHRLSDLAVRGFRTTDEAFQAILTLVAEQLHLRSSFLTRITPELNRNHILQSYNQPGGCGVPAGADLPLDQTYCSLVVDDKLGPCIITDTRTNPLALGHPASTIHLQVGCFIGVPIVLQDGTMFGTLCAVDPEPHELTAAQTELLVVLARLIATQLERDRELEARLQVEEQLQQHAWHDSLTGLPNRVLLSERLTHALAGARRSRSSPFAVLFLDLDRFKPINDSLGHPAGDELLVETARRLQRCVRPTDTVARWGGDEFVMLLPDIPDLVQVTHLAERVQESLSEPFVLGGHTVATTASIGIVTGPGQYRSSDDVLRDADIAMYRAKAQGKAQFAIFDPEMHAKTLARLWLEGDLRRAIEREELVLHYQPIVELASERMVQLEVLVRWKHPERGIVPPAEFVPLAEEIGAIRQLDRWVLRGACRQYQAWVRAGISPVPLTVNVSLRQATHSEFVDEVLSTLREFRVAPHHLVVEMTEHTLTMALRETSEALGRLRAAGVQVWLDNFGAGASSLGYLAQLPLDGVKIDRCFVQSLPSDSRQLAVTNALIGMAEQLGIALVAEGVETLAQRDVLHQHGCHAGQGYLLGRPVPACELAPLLSRQLG